MRITKKMIAEAEAKEALLTKNTNRCITMLTQKLNLTIDKDGYMVIINDDDGWSSPMKYAGKRLVSTLVGKEIDPAIEMAFDPYNNVKLMISLVNQYVEMYMDEDTDILSLSISSKKLNTLGFAEIKFMDGTSYAGNEYYRDALKYMDIIYILDGSAPPEFMQLKAIDMK